MDLRKIIGVGILALLVCQSALLGAGSFFICLHHAGEPHVAQDSLGDNCCHGPETISEQVNCYDHCTDIKVTTLELLPWRDNGRLLSGVVIGSVGFNWMNVGLPSKAHLYTQQLSRAPPMVAPMSIRFAQTVCLRI